MSKSFLIDSHCHSDRLDLKNYHDDLALMLEAAERKRVGRILNACVRLEEFNHLLAITKQFGAKMCCSIGVHPSESVAHEPTVDELVTLGGSSQLVVAVGETGLDYQDGNIDHVTQQERFKIHIEASRRLQKPLIIHHRLAKADMLKILQTEKNIIGVMHCFTEDFDFAKQVLDLGFYLSFSGILTFKNATIIRDTIKRVPLDRVLLETDAPYLAPVPMRGKSNVPEYLYYTATYLADFLQIPLDILAEVTTQNFYRLFGNHFLV